MSSEFIQIFIAATLIFVTIGFHNHKYLLGIIGLNCLLLPVSVSQFTICPLVAAIVAWFITFKEPAAVSHS